MQQPVPQPGGAPAPESQSSGGTSQLVIDINAKLNQLAELIEEGGDDGDRAALAQVQQSYQALIEGLSQAPGAKKPEAPQAPGVVPAQAGAREVAPAM